MTLEVGTRGLNPEHVERYVAIAHRIGARVLRTVLSGSLCGPDRIAQAEAPNQACSERGHANGVRTGLIALVILLAILIMGFRSEP